MRIFCTALTYSVQSPPKGQNSSLCKFYSTVMENAKSLNLTKSTINVTSQLVLFASKLRDIKVTGALVDGSPCSQVSDEKHDETICVDNCTKDFFL